MDALHSRSISDHYIRDAVLPSRMYMNGIVLSLEDTLSCSMTEIGKWKKFDTHIEICPLELFLELEY